MEQNLWIGSYAETGTHQVQFTNGKISEQKDDNTFENCSYLCKNNHILYSIIEYSNNPIYQNGYIITIDGKKVDSFCVNKAFLGSKISSGKHQIEITFKAPAKNISLFGSGIGLVLLLLHGRRERNEERFKRIN